MRESGHNPIPTVIEQTARSERVFDIYSHLLRERIVFLGDQIDDALANLVVAQLLFLEAQDPKQDVAMYINSAGGSSTALFAIYDAMQALEPDVATYCLGQAASAAAVILAAGATGKRRGLPNSRVLLHQPHGGIEGRSADLEIRAREIARMRRHVEEILAAHTGQPLERIVEDTERDFILDAAAAREYGVIDEIVAFPRLVPVA